MKTAVVVLIQGDKFEDLSQLTHPTIKNYANKIGSDFIVISEPYPETINHPHWSKFKMYDLFKEYQRMIFLDTDLIVRDDCPNLFDIVPENKFGMFNEGKYVSRLGSIQEAAKCYKTAVPKWSGDYYNSGVMVISRIHRNLFKLPDVIHPMGMHEQAYLNLKIATENIEMFDLPYTFNRMHIMDQLTGEPRQASYIVHCAGAPSKEDIIRVLGNDLNDWKNHEPDYKYKKNVCVVVGGGLGDQVESVPVCRHLSKIYKNDNVIIYSHYPELFDHLTNENIFSKKWNPNDALEFPTLRLETMPDSKTNDLWNHVSSTLCHHVDFTSLSCKCNILPNKDKEIGDIFKDKNIEQEAIDITGDEKVFENMILIHPGKGWESKTFPVKWWNEIINGIANNKNINVGIIGKYVNEEQGYVNVEWDKSKTNIYDFRDLLSLTGLFGIIKICPLLISNDSAPVHIAGCYDNHILLIPTCKHPDHVLPYRHGTNSYNSTVMYKRLLTDDLENSPSRVVEETVDKFVKDVYEYIPDSKDVVYHSVKYVTKQLRLKDGVYA